MKTYKFFMYVSISVICLSGCEGCHNSLKTQKLCEEQGGQCCSIKTGSGPTDYYSFCGTAGQCTTKLNELPKFGGYPTMNFPASLGQSGTSGCVSN